MSSYAKLLSDKRWKDKRYEILQRDGFACTNCKATGRLHVHHLAYGDTPWDVEDEYLITLCATCHKKEHVGKTDDKPLGRYILNHSHAIERASAEAYEAMPTLGVLMGAVKFENLARLRSTLIVARLGVSQATVDRHLVKLRKIGLIEPDEAEGDRQRSIFNWRVCPYLAWKGHTDTLDVYMRGLTQDHVWHSYKEPR